MQEQYLGSAGFVVEAGLSVRAFLAAEGWIGEDDIEQRRRALEQPRVGGLIGESVAVPEMRMVDAMQHQIGQRDGIDQVFLFPAVEGAFLQRGVVFRRRAGLIDSLFDVLVALGEEAASAATGIVHRLANPGIDYPHHGADDFTGSEKLAAVIVLLPHFEQQPFVDLGESEDVGRVNGLMAEVVNPVEDVEEVALGVDTHPLHAAHDLADHFLPHAGVGLAFQALEVRKQAAIDEGEQFAELAGFHCLAQRSIRRGPILPAIGRGQRWGKGATHSLGFFLFLGFDLVENAQEQHPGQFGNVLHRAGHVAPAHDVADGFDGLIDGLAGIVRFTTGGFWSAARHD